MSQIITVTRIRPEVAYTRGQQLITVTPQEKPYIVISRAGVQGPPGPPGPAGASGGQPLKFTFPESSLWNIPHNLNREPTISVYTTGGLLVLAQVLHLSNNTAQVSFDEALAGYAVVV